VRGDFHPLPPHGTAGKRVRNICSFSSRYCEEGDGRRGEGRGEKRLSLLPTVNWSETQRDGREKGEWKTTRDEEGYGMVSSGEHGGERGEGGEGGHFSGVGKV